MRNVLNLIEKNRNIRKKTLIVFIVLSFLVAIFTISFLIRPAYSAVNKADCGITEHIHVSQCYSEHKKFGESVLICSSDISSETLSHIHDDFCYDEKGKIICPLTEYQHIHTDDCYDENGVQTCGAAYHQHGEDCFRILGENESALVLECGKASHVHVESCYPELSIAHSEVLQDDFEETQNIEPDFKEAEFIEPEMELYEPAIDNGIALFNDENAAVVSSDRYVLTQNNIKSVKLEYKDENGTWIVVTDGMENVPANTGMRIEVKYQINKTDILNNQIVYEGIPTWMNPDNTGNIYNEDGEIVASLSVGGGNAVITFEQSYLNGLSNATIDGTFSVEGSADWRKIENTNENVTLPSLGFNFKFEGDLSAKYGNFKVEKSHTAKTVEVWDENENITHTYIKYELKVKSLESDKDISKICITDVLSTDNRVVLSDVIKGNGYVGVTETEKVLGSSANGYDPYEIMSSEENTHGNVVLENKNLKWNIDNLKPNEERTLVYYVELNEKYVGSGSAGTLINEATPESGGNKRETVRDEFTPKADVDITKTQGAAHVDDFGDGTIDYTVRVTANSNNSYTITDACIKDAFRDGMADYIDTPNSMEVTVNGTKQNVNIGTNGFTVDVPALKAGESVTITYSVPVKGLFSKTNGNVSFSNHASFVSKDNNGKTKHGYTFKGSGVTTTVRHNQWMRKLNGEKVDTARTIAFNNNNVYNYSDNPTKQTDITEFTVPQNAQEYTVIVNEDGTWDMSNANFVDNFNDDRISYTGYLKIEEFNKTDEIPKNNSLNNETVLSTLNKQTPTNTVWVNINGRNSFAVNPHKYGLTDANKVYRLTYYAAVDPSQTNIKNIVVANNFSITGSIGIGDKELILSGVHTAVSSTLTGSASYDFDKESLFHEKKPNTSGNGDIYWVIRANGTLPKNLHIKDNPTSKNSIYSDSLVGVYMGDKGYDFSKITSSDELNTALSNMDELERGTSKYFYNLQSITSLAELNGQDFAIFSRGENNGHSGYLMTGGISTTKNGENIQGITGRILNTQFNFGTEVETTEIVQKWHFELAEGETDKFYIYYTDSLNREHYMHITYRSATISTEKGEPFTVKINDNKIKIANPDDKRTGNNNLGEALNWYGNNGSDKYYSGWNNGNGENNWHYLGNLDEEPRYSYKPQKITDVNDLDGKEFAIITPGDVNSGLLVGGASDKKVDALIGEWYTTKFSDDPPTITRKTPLQKWTFNKIDGASNEFYVYYTDENNQKYYLKLGNDSATTTVTPTTVKIGCKDGKIRLTTPNGKMALDWNGGGQGAQEMKPYYSTWKNEVDSDNRLHYVATEEIISAESSNYDYSWNNNGGIKINKDTIIEQDKSVYIVMRTHPDETLSGNHSKIFDNEVGIVDNTTGDFYKLDGSSYIYKPNLPLYKEEKVAVYYNAEEQDTTKQWKICSVHPGDARGDGKNVWTQNANSVFSNERDIIKAKGSGLYMEWLLNVNWDGTIEGDVILTEHLEHKMEPVLVRQFNLGTTSTQSPPEYKTIPELENDPEWEKMQTHEMPFYYNNKTGELKVAVGNLHKAASENSAVVNLQLICRVTDPDVIFSGINSTLTNKADLTKPDGTFIGKQEIKHEILPTYSVKKDVNGVGANNNSYHSNKLEYTIVINPLSEDLIVGGDTLPVLIDKMSSNMELIGDIEVFKKVDNDESKLDNIKYSIDKKETETTIKFDSLPDQAHLIIKYKTRVNVKQNQQANISNIAYWEGYSEPSKPQHSETFQYTLGGTVSSNNHPVVVINKRDFYNNGITLGGAEFEIRKVDTNGNVDANPLITATTNNDGKISITDQTLDYNTVYQLKEIKAPTEYVLDNAPKYFMVVNGSHNYPESIDNDGKMTIDEKLVDVIIDYPAGQGSTDLELTIYNQKGRVRVDKVFLDESDNTIAQNNVKFFGTYRFGLYYKSPTSNNTKPEQILSITYSGTNKPLYALDGKVTSDPEFTKAKAGAANFIYELNEKNEPINNGNNAYLNGYSFDVTYSSNSVVVPQKIDLTNPRVVTITNKYHPIYLPMAGGMGRKNYYKISFFALTILATLTAAVFRVRRKCK